MRRSVLLLVLLALATAFARAQKSPNVVLLSDIHFDTYQDPAKVETLRKTPASEWLKIFNAPATPTQAADFEKLNTTCSMKGSDTAPALLESSLAAMHAQQPTPAFVTVSGDLMAHQFDCRFHTLFPSASEADYSAFAAKTVAFISLRLHHTFPTSPIYLALGNNDSGCTDYHEDPGSSFLRSDAASFSTNALNPGNASAILNTFPQRGDYNVTLPLPNTHLLVLQDIFESKNYASCGAKPGKAKDGSPSNAAADQIAWLRAQLTAARAAHQRVWVMAHIPPGVNAYATFSKSRNVCGGDAPDMFLSSEALADALTDFADIIPLALFGHSHMDEIRLLHASAGAAVPVKLVPSISPVNGNDPAFTIAQVDPSTAVLEDYTVYSASNHTGIATTWSREYTYSSTYNLPDLSSASLTRLTSSFVADKSSQSPLSQSYQRFFFVGVTGLRATAMKMAWPSYACSITQDHPADFRSCMCPAKPTL